MRLTMSDHAKAIAEREGKKVNLTIAQIREVLRIQRDLVQEDMDHQVAIHRYWNRELSPPVPKPPENEGELKVKKLSGS